MKNPQPPSRTRTEYRCSPQSGRVYSVQVPVQSSPTPPTPVQPAKQYEWRCDSQTGRTYQVELPAIQQPSVGQLLPPHHPPWSNLRSRHGQLGATSHQQQQCLGTDDFNQQLQKQMTGIVKLCESGGGVTKKAMKILDFAKKGSTKWAKKATIDSINLPLFTLGAVSELESSLSGRQSNCQRENFSQSSDISRIILMYVVSTLSLLTSRDMVGPLPRIMPWKLRKKWSRSSQLGKRCLVEYKRTS